MRDIAGAGLGLRRALLGPLADGLAESAAAAPDFFEVAPENWIGVGGRYGRRFREFTERYPFVTHGLSLSLGSPAPLDLDLVRSIGTFLDSHGIAVYSEHLSYCSDDGHLYDLMPLPFTPEAVQHVAARIRTVQDVLGRRIAVENVSYYTSPLGDTAPMGELEFLNAVLAEADCDLLLDVNNVYVNSINHRYDPRAFIAGVPAHRVRYIHVAGHYDEAPDLKVDTHGAAVIDPVWDLLAHAYRQVGVRPTLLERDFNMPPLAELLAEVGRVRDIQQAGSRQAKAS
ncbi:MAG: DUF692 domain-containing protein [Pseudomonadota bacterium]